MKSMVRTEIVYKIFELDDNDNLISARRPSATRDSIFEMFSEYESAEKAEIAIREEFDSLKYFSETDYVIVPVVRVRRNEKYI